MMKGESDDNIITTAADRSKPEKKRDEKHAQKASKAKVKIDELDEEILQRFKTDQQKEHYRQFVQNKRSKGGRGGRVGESVEGDNDADRVATDLIERMYKAYDNDRQANVEGRPAIQKLILSQEVYALLRKSTVQEEFITGDRGHDVLAKWLEVMPDGTFPSVNLVKGLLECINSL